MFVKYARAKTAPAASPRVAGGVVLGDSFTELIADANHVALVDEAIGSASGVDPRIVATITSPRVAPTTAVENRDDKASVMAEVTVVVTLVEAPFVMSDFVAHSFVRLSLGGRHERDGRCQEQNRGQGET
jgi:hypothetical protein